MKNIYPIRFCVNGFLIFFEKFFHFFWMGLKAFIYGLFKGFLHGFTMISDNFFLFFSNFLPFRDVFLSLFSDSGSEILFFFCIFRSFFMRFPV